MSSSLMGPFTLRMMLRSEVSSRILARTWVTPPRDPVRPMIFVTWASLASPVTTPSSSALVTSLAVVDMLKGKGVFGLCGVRWKGEGKAEGVKFIGEKETM